MEPNKKYEVPHRIIVLIQSVKGLFEESVKMYSQTDSNTHVHTRISPTYGRTPLFLKYVLAILMNLHFAYLNH